ncbi:hypothetical protein PS1_000490 [Malus domestica]
MVIITLSIKGTDGYQIETYIRNMSHIFQHQLAAEISSSTNITNSKNFGIAFIPHLHYAKVTFFVCTKELLFGRSMERNSIVKDPFNVFVRVAHMQTFTNRQYFWYITTYDSSGIAIIIFLLIVSFLLLSFPNSTIFLHMAFFATMVAYTPEP